MASTGILPVIYMRVDVANILVAVNPDTVASSNKVRDLLRT
jgi:hypothetical protein